MTTQQLSTLTEQERLQYDRRGLYLHPHQFEMPILIEEALKEFTSLGACILIFDQDTIYETPEPELDECDCYIGTAGYVDVLKQAYRLLFDYISCDWDRLDPNERDEAVRIDTYLIAMKEFFSTLECPSHSMRA